ncbi:MAG: chemotaxis response regulator protein-glutamate methylesterase [Myxococcales bacterium FL481]|nr:MAG: chemotaxis response regulator protein-glutamate methylesterase [Myxococcales bacterium FL481]
MTRAGSGNIRVLVVDDSALARKILCDGLNECDGIEVVGAAHDPYEARDLIVKLDPDVITLDVEMPKMDGVEFLRRLMPQYPKPVVMVSSLTTRGGEIAMQALEAGAVDLVLKPTSQVERGLEAMLLELSTKVRIASTANVSEWKNRRPPKPRASPVASAGALAVTTDKVVVIGASTGGTEAIRAVLSGLPITCPGVVIVQHMPAVFTKIYADNLNKDLRLHVKQAESGDRVLAGRVFIAPGDLQMRITRSGGQYRLQCEDGPKVCGHRPSVEVLMQSAAKSLGSNAVGVMLTGMGRDGADGLLAMRKAGARTFAQDEATSVVFGMPREAHLNGGAERLVPLRDMAGTIMGALGKMAA